MIDRRSILLAGAALGASWIFPAGSPPRVSAAPVEFDLIDVSIWTGGSSIPAPVLIDRGGFLLPTHLRHMVQARRLTAALSPANAVLLAEYLRFDRGVVLQEHASRTDTLAWLRADTRIITVHWTG